MGQQEVETADWGDERLDSRFELLLSALGSRPNRSIPAAWGGRAEMQAAYRFFDNDKVTFDKVLQPHLTRTVQRLAEQTVVLVVQDTSEIDRTRPAQAVTGIADLTDARRGFLLHALQAFTCDGVPLGTVGTERVNRTDGISHACAAAKDHQKKHRPIEAKESFRWLTGLRRVRELAEQLPQVQCVGLADSEADIYEVFAEPPGAAQWLIRACQDRALQQAQPLLRPHVLTTPVLYQAELRIRGRKAMTAVEQRSWRQNRDNRQAAVDVRATTVTLRPPWRFDRELPPISANVVLVREPNPPADEPPVEWLLVTTLPIATAEQVRTIVAWRALGVCRMGRECPDLDCEAIFEPSEWKALWMAVQKKKPPKRPPKLAALVHLIAGLGGYVERPQSEPGPQTLWIGLQRMYDLAWAWDSFGPGAKGGGH